MSRRRRDEISNPFYSAASAVATQVSDTVWPYGSIKYQQEEIIIFQKYILEIIFIEFLGKFLFVFLKMFWLMHL